MNIDVLLSQFLQQHQRANRLRNDKLLKKLTSGAAISYAGSEANQNYTSDIANNAGAELEAVDNSSDLYFGLHGIFTVERTMPERIKKLICTSNILPTEGHTHPMPRISIVKRICSLCARSLSAVRRNAPSILFCRREK